MNGFRASSQAKDNCAAVAFFVPSGLIALGDLRFFSTPLKARTYSFPVLGNDFSATCLAV
jgi:hypothetical protein